MMTTLPNSTGVFVLNLDDLSCGRDLDFSNFDLGNAVASSFVIKLEQPSMNEIQPTPLQITIDEVEETKKMFVMFNLSELEKNSDQTLDQEVPTTVPNVPICTVFDVLMVQQTHFPALKPDIKMRDIRQQNAVVSYIRN